MRENEERWKELCAQSALEQGPAKLAPSSFEKLLRRHRQVIQTLLRLARGAAPLRVAQALSLCQRSPHHHLSALRPAYITIHVSSPPPSYRRYSGRIDLQSTALIATWRSRRAVPPYMCCDIDSAYTFVDSAREFSRVRW